MFKPYLRFIADLLLIAVVVIAFIALSRKTEQDKAELKEYWEKEGFKTDTVYVDIDYAKLPKPEFKYTVPPAQVIVYRDSSVTHIKAVLNDSLLSVIDSLQGTITNINHRYFKLYPTASKLLYGEFTSDSLNIDFLSIDGTIRTYKYGVNYDRFKYQYRDGEFKADPISKHQPVLSDWFGYGGYDALFKAPVLGTDYSIYKNKLRLKGNSFITIQKQPQFSAQISLGYKIR